MFRVIGSIGQSSRCTTVAISRNSVEEHIAIAEDDYIKIYPAGDIFTYSDSSHLAPVNTLNLKDSAVYARYCDNSKITTL